MIIKERLLPFVCPEKLVIYEMLSSWDNQIKINITEHPLINIVTIKVIHTNKVIEYYKPLHFWLEQVQKCYGSYKIVLTTNNDKCIVNNEFNMNFKVNNGNMLQVKSNIFVNIINTYNLL